MVRRKVVPPCAGMRSVRSRTEGLRLVSRSDSSLSSVALVHHDSSGLACFPRKVRSSQIPELGHPMCVLGAVRYYESSAASTAPLCAEEGREDETSAVDDVEQVQDEEHVDNSPEVDTISVAAPGTDADAHRYCKGLLHYLKSGKATERFKDLRKNEAEFDIGARRYVVQNLRSVLEHVAKKEVEVLAQGPPSSLRNKMDETDPGTLFAATQQPCSSSASGGYSGNIGLHSEDLANYPYLLRQMQITDAGTLEPLLDLVVNRILQKRFRLVYAWKRPGGEADDHHSSGGAEKGQINSLKKSTSGGTASTFRKGKTSTSTSSSSEQDPTFAGEHQDAKLPKVPSDFRKTAKLPSQLSTFVKTLKELPVDFKGPLHAVRRFADKVVEHLERFDTATLCFLLDELHSRGVPLDVVHHRARFYRELCSRLVEGGKGGATDQQHVREPMSVPSTQERQILLEKLTPVVFEDHGSAKFALLSEDPHNLGGKKTEPADAAVELEESQSGATRGESAAADKTATTVLENGKNAQEKQEGRISEKALSRAADAKAVQQASEDLQALKLFLGSQLRLQIVEAKDVRELEVRCGALLRYFLDQSFDSCTRTRTEEGLPDASNVQKQFSPHGAAPSRTSANKTTAPTATGQESCELSSKQAILRDFCVRARGLVKAQKEYGKLLWHTRGLEHWARAEIVREWFLPMVDAVKSGRNAMDLFLVAKWLEMMTDLEETDLPEVGELRELLTKRILARKTDLLTSSVAISLLLATGKKEFLDLVTDVPSLSPADLKKVMRLPNADLRWSFVLKAAKCADRLSPDQLLVLVTGQYTKEQWQELKKLKLVGPQKNAGARPASTSSGDIKDEKTAQQTWASPFEDAMRRKLWQKNAKLSLEDLNGLIAAMTKSHCHDSRLLATIRNAYTRQVLGAPVHAEF
ncbi:unnamed protein product [Amoebophrya sp. A120]|nr:unnamed protein product [Amoebophrya sp. A120]|eukprot:GSA120T00018266001.1